jgi:Txe/YoeB family toxin of toxin-antitoxin system
VKLVWDESAWEDYLWWQSQDRKILRRINTLIRDVDRNGNEGIGKPEPHRCLPVSLRKLGRPTRHVRDL